MKNTNGKVIKSLSATGLLHCKRSNRVIKILLILHSATEKLCPQNGRDLDILATGRGRQMIAFKSVKKIEKKKEKTLRNWPSLLVAPNKTWS